MSPTKLASRRSNDTTRSTITNQASEETSILPPDYPAFLAELKARVRKAQLAATSAANRELIRMYWDLGRDLIARQRQAGWGAKILERLATDLQHEFPGVRGFTRRNLHYARSFYRLHTDRETTLQQPVGASEEPTLPESLACIPWGHNMVLVDKLDDPVLCIWYAQKSVESGWSRAVLEHQIETRLHERMGRQDQATNFVRTLPAKQSDLAREMLKDPYNFEFLTIASDAREREVEEGLLTHLRKFLLELGTGFAFVGSQYRLVVGGEDFFIDLLFYHLTLRRFIVVDIKMRPFEPGFAGKMGFYLAAVDRTLKKPGDEPAIGLILCKSKNSVIAEYALQNLIAPVGVADYHVRTLPDSLSDQLPSAEALTNVLQQHNASHE